VKHSLLLVTALLGLIIVMSFSVFASPTDSLAQYRKDGKLTIPGGEFAPELQALLSIPSPQLETKVVVWNVYQDQDTSDSTASWSRQESIKINQNVYISKPVVLKPLDIDLLEDVIMPVWDALESFVSLDWLFGTASAANRYLVLGDGACTTTALGTDAGCWSATSGGAGGAGVPTSADATFADAASGAGAGTQDAAIAFASFTGTGFTGTWNTGNFAFTSSGAVAIDGTWNLGSSTFTIGGNFDNVGSTWNVGTSTVVSSATGTYDTIVTCCGTNGFYNWTINTGVTVTANFANQIANELTLSGTATLAMTFQFMTIEIGEIIADVGTTLTCSGGAYVVFFGLTAGKTIDADPTWDCPVTLGASFTFMPSGNWTVSDTLTLSDGNGNTVFDTNGFNVQFDGLVVGQVSALNSSFVGNASTVTVNGNVVVSAASCGAGCDYIDFGSSAWTVSGTWTNYSTSSSWDAGTGSITFTSATGGTMLFANSGLGENEFGKVTFATSAGTTQTFTMSGALRVGGPAGPSITISNNTTVVTANYAVDSFTTTAFLTVGAGGTLTAGSTTFTVPGDWDTSAGTFTAGTSTVNVTASASISIATSAGFATLNVSAGTTTAATNLEATTLTVTSTLAMGTFNLTFDHLDVNGTMTMDGESVLDLDIDTDIGTISLTAFTLYSVTAGLPDIQFDMNPSSAGADITFIVEGLLAATTFRMLRDTIEIGNIASDGGGTWTFDFTGGWSPHSIQITVPGLLTSGGGGTPGQKHWNLLWTWTPYGVEDLTIQFVITTPVSDSNVKYVWTIDGTIIGTGDTLIYQFPLSGTYNVTVDMTINNKSLVKELNAVNDTTKEVVVRSSSFLGRYLPALVLLVIAMWYVVLLIAETIKSKIGQYAGFIIALGAFGAAYYLVGTPYRTIPINGQNAFMLYIGMGLFCAAGSAKSRLATLILGAVGGGLMIVVFGLLRVFY